MMRYIDLSVFRWDGPDCTLDGVSSKAAQVRVVGVVTLATKGAPRRVFTPLPAESVPDTGIRFQSFDPDAPGETPPLVAVEVRHMGGPVLSICPVEPGTEPGTYEPMRAGKYGTPMMGGNYAATSDSRFSQLLRSLTGGPFYGALAIHDRFE